jgi:hypothetical protein
LEIYENSPDEYVQKLHKWFTAEQAEGRAKAKKVLGYYVSFESNISL